MDKVHRTPREDTTQGKDPLDVISSRQIDAIGRTVRNECKADFYPALNSSPQDDAASCPPDEPYDVINLAPTPDSSADGSADSSASVSPMQLAVMFHEAVPHSRHRLSRTESIRKRPRAEQTSPQQTQRSPSASQEF